MTNDLVFVVGRALLALAWRLSRLPTLVEPGRIRSHEVLATCHCADD